MPETTPSAAVIPRRGRGTAPPEGAGSASAADWASVHAALRTGDAGPYWLTTPGPDGAPHVRPVFAAWSGSSFFVASKHGAVKSRNLRADGRFSIAVDVGPLHVVVNGHAVRVTDPGRLELASRTMREVFDWPTTVAGEELDAGYAAPTSGGPPFEVYELIPDVAWGFPTRDEVEPTRWTFPR